MCVCSPSAQQPARTRTALTLLNTTQHNTVCLLYTLYFTLTLLNTVCLLYTTPYAYFTHFTLHLLYSTQHNTVCSGHGHSHLTTGSWSQHITTVTAYDRKEVVEMHNLDPDPDPAYGMPGVSCVHKVVLIDCAWPKYQSSCSLFSSRDTSLLYSIIPSFPPFPSLIGAGEWGQAGDS